MSTANVLWGGKPDCCYRYVCVLFCPQMASMQLAQAIKQLAQAIKQRRAMDAGVSPWSSAVVVAIAVEESSAKGAEVPGQV